MHIIKRGPLLCVRAERGFSKWSQWLPRWRIGPVMFLWTAIHFRCQENVCMAAVIAGGSEAIPTLFAEHLVASFQKKVVIIRQLL